MGLRMTSVVVNSRRRVRAGANPNCGVSERFSASRHASDIPEVPDGPIDKRGLLATPGAHGMNAYQSLCDHEASLEDELEEVTRAQVLRGQQEVAGVFSE